MSAPFTVSYADRAGCVWYSQHDHLREAIEAALTGRETHGAYVDIHGDGYDCDADGRGYYVCDDGLTEVERELIERALDRRRPSAMPDEVPAPVCALREICSRNLVAAMQAGAHR